jgi:hypothetical protein
MESGKPFTVDMRINRGEKQYQEISVADDYNMSTTFTPLEPNNNISDGVTIRTYSNPAAFIKKGLYITETSFVSLTTLTFIVMVLIILTSVITYFVSRGGYSMKLPTLNKLF